jgi:uncharacterized metal-binding protein YceD (DUF177 family)
MFKKNLKLNNFSDFASEDYVLNLTIPAVEFSRLSDLILNDGGLEENHVSINLEFFTEQNNILKLKGKIFSLLTFQCYRCLGPVGWQKKTLIDLSITDQSNQVKTKQSSINSISVGYDGVSIEKIVEDEILSMIPMSLMHKTVALCENNDTLSMFLTASGESDNDQKKNKPFAGLSKLLKNKN